MGCQGNGSCAISPTFMPEVESSGLAGGGVAFIPSGDMGINSVQGFMPQHSHSGHASHGCSGSGKDAKAPPVMIPPGVSNPLPPRMDDVGFVPTPPPPKAQQPRTQIPPGVSMAPVPNEQGGMVPRPDNGFVPAPPAKRPSNGKPGLAPPAMKAPVSMPVPQDLGKPSQAPAPVTTLVPLIPVGQSPAPWSPPDYCSDDRFAATELCRQGGDAQLSPVCRAALRAWIASGDKSMSLAAWVSTQELCAGELQRLLGLVESTKNSGALYAGKIGTGFLILHGLPEGSRVMVDNYDVRGVWVGDQYRVQLFPGEHAVAVVPPDGKVRRASVKVYRGGGGATLIFSAMSADPYLGSKPSGAMWPRYRASGVINPDAANLQADEGSIADQIRRFNQSNAGQTLYGQELAQANAAAQGGMDPSGPSATDYITSIGGAANAAFANINATIRDQAAIRLRELELANANTANARANATQQFAIETQAAIQRLQAQAAAAPANSPELEQLRMQVAALTQTRNQALSAATDEGLSTEAKVGIGVGVVAVLGAGAYLLTRRGRRSNPSRKARR